MDAATFFYVVVPLCLVLYCAIFGGFGAWVARQKGRSPSEGALLGMLLALFGVLIEALLPARHS